MCANIHEGAKRTAFLGEDSPIVVRFVQQPILCVAAHDRVDVSERSRF